MQEQQAEAGPARAAKDVGGVKHQAQQAERQRDGCPQRLASLSRGARRHGGQNVWRHILLLKKPARPLEANGENDAADGKDANKAMG